jgi:membrane protease YdiL (CAAX protease family)
MISKEAENKKKLLLRGVIGFFIIFIFPFICKKLNFIPPNSLSFGFLLIIFDVFVITIVSKGKLKEFGFRGFRIHDLPRPLFYIFIIAFSTNLLNKYFLKFEGVALHPQDKTYLLFLILLIGPITEEMTFRGLVQSVLQKLNWDFKKLRNIGFSFPVLFSASIFGVVHLTNVLVGSSWQSAIYISFTAFLGGLILAYYREKTGSVLISILLHMFANAIPVGLTLIERML